MAPVQVDTVERMCRDIMDFSHGKQKVKTSGIMEFGVSRDQFEPNVFYTWERYDSNGSLGRHNTCPEFQAFMENVCSLLSVSAPVSLHIVHAVGCHVVIPGRAICACFKASKPEQAFL